VKRFLSKNVPQLLTLADDLLGYKVTAEELDRGIWQVLESWVNSGKPKTQVPSGQELVFWDLLGMMHSHKPYELRGHRVLRTQLETRIDYLRHPGQRLPENLTTPPLAAPL